MSDKKDRRDFLKIAAVGAASVAAGPLLMKGAAAADVTESQRLLKGATTADVAEDQRLVREAATADTIRINPNAKAMLPSGKLADRREILRQLGLDPNTPADSWLVIYKCGGNAAGLTDESRKQLKLKGIEIDIESGQRER